MNFSLNFTTRNLVPRLHRFTSKIAVEVEPAVVSALEHATLKPRKHPGVVRPNHVELPKQLNDTLKRIVGDHPVKKLIHDGQQLNAYIKSRHPPPTLEEIENKKRIVIEEVNTKMPLDRLATLDEDEAERWRIIHIRLRLVTAVVVHAGVALLAGELVILILIGGKWIQFFELEVSFPLLVILPIQADAAYLLYEIYTKDTTSMPQSIW